MIRDLPPRLLRIIAALPIGWATAANPFVIHFFQSASEPRVELLSGTAAPGMVSPVEIELEGKKGQHEF